VGNCQAGVVLSLMSQKRRESEVCPSIRMSLALLFPAMATLDPAAEWRRLEELYRRMADGELLGLARTRSELTEVAQEALGNEIRQRRLTVEPEAAPAPPPMPETPSDSPYYEDRQLVQIAMVWSLADALQVQRLLDQAAIPFCMGPEKATRVDGVTSNFADGVAVGVMRIGWPWASQVMQHYQPVNDPQPKPEEQLADVIVRCPKCHSEDVIFDELVGEIPTTEKNNPQQYEWTCAACGNRWKDDGIVGK
jgi:DNA-directed RNA polymerase subunit M/transcription elongation factor TFIIS